MVLHGKLLRINQFCDLKQSSQLMLEFQLLPLHFVVAVVIPMNYPVQLFIAQADRFTVSKQASFFPKYFYSRCFAFCP